MRWYDLRRLQRMSARYTDHWTARGKQIYQNDTMVATCATEDFAALMAAQHNHFIPAINVIIALCKKIGDKHALTLETTN